MDAGPPLPEEPDPDLGPDSRPSDYVDAGAWLPPPDIAPDDPCCTLGEPIRITSRDEGMAFGQWAPSIAWGPGRWGLLATRTFVRPGPDDDPHQVVFELAPDGTSLGPPVVLDSTTTDPGVIAWAEGRWAVAVTAEPVSADVREWTARLFDRDFRPATGWLPVGPARVFQLALARLTVTGHWEAVRNDGAAIRETPFSGAGVEPDDEVDPSPGSGLAAVGMRSRLATLVGRDSPAQSEVVITGPPPDHARLGSVTLRARYPQSVTIAALRDVAVVAGIEGTDAHAEVVDPFAAHVVGGIVSLGPAASTVVPSGAIDADGSDKLGVAGVCWASRSSDDGRGSSGSWIDFRLVGPDGVARGSAVRVIDAPFRGGQVSCTVGSDDVGFLVAWWDGSALWVRRVEVARSTAR